MPASLAPVTLSDMAEIGHNGGPPLDEPAHEWGNGPFGKYFEWKAAVHDAYHGIPVEIAVMRACRAAKLGLTYEEYALEILERGRFLQASDTDRILEIKRRREL
ncbi:hypothetical protein ACFSX5_04330 [Devosia albogilva]|uniref:Nitrile hydratase beta subunit domain-containing protein n=1 Tax=Devosia albogilva TaxID=429726 RepID=A0ABW5QHG5_9HYPH